MMPTVMKGPYNQHVPVPPNPALLQRRTSAGMSYETICHLINLEWDFFEQMDRPPVQRFVNPAYPVEELRKIHQPIYQALCNMAISIEAAYVEHSAGGDLPLVK